MSQGIYLSFCHIVEHSFSPQRLQAIDVTNSSTINKFHGTKRTFSESTLKNIKSKYYFYELDI